MRSVMVRFMRLRMVSALAVGVPSFSTSASNASDVEDVDQGVMVLVPVARMCSSMSLRTLSS